MKRAAVFACTLAFVSAVCAAQAPSVAPLTDEALAMILGEPGAAGACPAPQGDMVLAAKPVALPKICNATATCQSGTVSCSVSGPGGTCTFANRDCSICERGHVTCNGVTTLCSTPCCNTGTIIQKQCCQCDCTGDCMSCCRCGGGSLGECAMQCG